MKEITLDATPENIGVATDFVEEFLDEIFENKLLFLLPYYFLRYKLV